MKYEAEISFFCRLMEKYGVHTYRFASANPPESLRDLLPEMELPALNLKIFRGMRDRVLYDIRDPLLCNYNALLLTESDEVLLVGPYLIAEVPEETVMHVMERLHMPMTLLSTLKRHYSTIPLFPREDGVLLTALNTLGELLWGNLNEFELERIETGPTMDIGAIPQQQLNTAIDAADIQMMEKRYDGERRLMYAVSHGMTHQAQMLISRCNEQTLDQRTTDSLRNLKNYGIVLNTLLRKAVEQGAVHPLHIDQLSNSMARRLERVQTIKEGLALFSTMVHKYCLLVKNHSMKQYSLLVQHVILRIDTDLTSDLSLSALAAFLNMNPSYLSTLFKKETGMTLTEYVNRQRVEHGLFLLNTTDMQIQTIAQYCGVPDVNYFTKMFKKLVGQTPKSYRQSIHESS